MRTVSLISFSFIAFVIQASNAIAQDKFFMVGAAPAGEAAQPRGENFDPYSGNWLSINGDIISTSNYTNNTKKAGKICESTITKSDYPYDDISNEFWTKDKFHKFIYEKFHLSRESIGETYYIADKEEGRMNSCSWMNFSHAFKSDNYIIILAKDSWVYVFQRMIHPPRDIALPLDCKMANTPVEHMICSNQKLIDLDGNVNSGFASTRVLFSKEISWQDTIGINQRNWIKNVRNKCSTTICLFSVYQDRVKYFKNILKDVWPNYPKSQDEDLPDYD